jgi:hypothetical protein
VSRRPALFRFVVGCGSYASRGRLGERREDGRVLRTAAAAGRAGDNRYEAGHTGGLRLLRVAARTRAEHCRDAAGRLYAAGAWNPARSAPRRTGTPAAGGPRNSAPAG